MLQARLYILGAVGLATLAGLGWGGRWLYKAGFDAAVVKAQREEKLIQTAAEAVSTAAAHAISEIQVRHVTIRQNLEKELTHDVVYRDCVASRSVFDLTNEALTGIADPTSNRIVPTAEPIN